MNYELILKIEIALKIKFSEWQINYLLDIPQVLDMRITGRCTGKTTLFIIKQLFESDEVLDLREVNKIYDYTDWWSVSHINEFTNHYSSFYKAYVYDIYNKLKDAKITTRKVIF